MKDQWINIKLVNRYFNSLVMVGIIHCGHIFNVLNVYFFIRGWGFFLALDVVGQKQALSHQSFRFTNYDSDVESVNKQC